MTPEYRRLIKKNHRRVQKVPCLFEDIPSYRHAVTGATLAVCIRPGCRRHMWRRGPGELHAGCFHPRFGLGTFLSRFFKIVSVGLLSSDPQRIDPVSGKKSGCDACNVRKVSLNARWSCNAPWWFVRLMQRFGWMKSQPLPWENERISPFLEKVKA